MSMDHWFDNLSRPHTRRATLKAAAVAGAALILPATRTPRASAAEREPCVNQCKETAFRKWDNASGACKTTGQTQVIGGYAHILSGSPGGALISLFGSVGYASCRSSTELTWYRETRACEDPDCGDPGKYPGGNVPHKKCDPDYEKACGDGCCRNFVDCCLSKKSGTYVCYAAGNNCEGA